MKDYIARSKVSYKRINAQWDWNAEHILLFAMRTYECYHKLTITVKRSSVARGTTLGGYFSVVVALIFRLNLKIVIMLDLGSEGDEHYQALQRVMSNATQNLSA